MTDEEGDRCSLNKHRERWYGSKPGQACASFYAKLQYKMLQDIAETFSTILDVAYPVPNPF